MYILSVEPIISLPNMLKATNGRNKYELTKSGFDVIDRRNALFRSVCRIVCRITVTDCNDRYFIIF